MCSITFFFLSPYVLFPSGVSDASELTEEDIQDGTKHVSTRMRQREDATVTDIGLRQTGQRASPSRRGTSRQAAARCSFKRKE